MFIIHMPESFKVGDTAACRINGEPTQLTWCNPNTLVIGTTDARYIVKTHVEDGLRFFFCGGEYGGEYGVEEVPGAGFIVFSKPEGGAS